MNKQTILWLFVLIFFYTGINAQSSQHEILKDYESGSFSVYKVNEKGKFEQIKKKWPISFTKSGDETSEVLVKRAGILDEAFKPDVPGYPAYYLFQAYRLTFQKDFAAYYTWDSRRGKAKAKYVFIKPNASLSLKPEELNIQIAKYAEATFAKQTSARADVKEAKLAELAKYSIKGKEVHKIEIKLLNKPSQVAHFSPAIEYGIIATLKDGSQFKTKNLGGKMPWDDFTINNLGGSDTPEKVRIDEGAKDLGKDQLIINVASKYNSGVKASTSLNATYDIGIQVNHNGYWGYDAHKHRVVFQGRDGQSAGNARHLTVKVKTIKHQQTGIAINKIEVSDSYSGEVLGRFKLTPSTDFTVNAKGGQGQDGWKGREGDSAGGNGGNGGRGGNVTIIKDPSVTTFNIKINNQGGKGGQGGAPYYSGGRRGNSGRSGGDGTTSTQVAPITLDF